jgi:hypothetical protein
MPAGRRADPGADRTERKHAGDDKAYFQFAIHEIH